MHTEVSTSDESGKAKVVENFSTISPDIDAAIFAEALVVETIHLGDLSAFVVAADECNSVWITNF